MFQWTREQVLGLACLGRCRGCKPAFALAIARPYCFLYERKRESNERLCSAAKQLEELSSLGHFLKGSSATLGLVKIRDGCENIQRYGKKENTDGSPLPDEEKCLKLIDETLKKVKEDYRHATIVLREHYPDKGDA